MSDETENTSEGVELPELDDQQTLPAAADSPGEVDEVRDGQEDKAAERSAADLEAVYDVPVNISAVLGKTEMDVSTLLHLSRGAVIELDRKVGEAIDIYVNDRLVARGEVVLVEEQLGVTMTEIIQGE